MALRQDHAEERVVRPAPGGSRRRRRWVAVLLALAVVGVATVAAAWVSAPSPWDPRHIVLERLRSRGDAFVPLASVSQDVRLAVVATEDERFYRHHGIDVVGIGRAAVYDVSHLSLSQAASPIAEQLAKNLYLGGDDRSPWRKLEDAILAVRTEARLSKDQILGLYLNSVYFGQGAYDVGAASERYFGQAEGEHVLHEPLLLADGQVLRPLLRISLAAGPHSSALPTPAGGALVGSAVVALVIARRRANVAVRAIAWASLLVGGVVARSLRVG